ncbi:VOC family protein [Ornithinibacillus salinisoli]|uniref:VOC family protein n=1 Tax=Ornithinibacillus salinisoli TaxID=1848459 RepID=A0ABW4VWQ1_9BACI
MIVEVYPYLVFNGNGQEAIRFYEDALDAKVLNVQTFGDMPDNPEMPISDEDKSRVLNAHLKIGNTNLMLSDTFPGQPYQTGSQITIAISIDNVEKSKEVFGVLEESGTVGMPLQETFWSPSYGQVTDKFGITWQVSTLKGEN